ncbi:MAG TPA: hypothetical protein VGL98_00415, partial [Gammaproteobacteria bacterium]
IIASACVWLASADLRGGQAFIATSATVLFAVVMFFGPMMARQDLRSDLKNADILKTYPLDGAQIVLGEMLAPIAVLSVMAWLALLAVALIGATAPIPVYVKVLAPVAVAVCVPFLCALQLVIHNGIAVIFPAWVASVSNQGEHGLDVLGQRLLFFAGQFLLLALGLLPALLGALITFFAVNWAAGPIVAAPLAWLVVLIVLGFEVWGGVRWLGERFARFDLSSELRP